MVDVPEDNGGEQLLNVLSSSGQISGDILLADQAAKGLQTAVDTTKNVATKVVDTVANTTENIANKVKGKVATTLENTPENIMNRVARLKPTDAQKFEKMTGMTHGDYLSKSGNFGNPDKIIANEAVKFTESLAQKDAALAKVPGTFKDPSIQDALSELAKKAEAESGANVKAPYLKAVNDLTTKFNTTGLTMPEVNTVKQLLESKVKLGYNKLMNGSEVAKATNIDDALRTFQDTTATANGITDISSLSKQIQASKFLINSLGGQIVGKTGLNGVSLTDWIMLSGGNPTSVAGFLTKKFFSSKSVQAKIAEYISKNDSTLSKPLSQPPPEILKSASPNSTTQGLKVKGAIPKNSGQLKVTNPSSFERDASLSPANKVIETKAFDHVLKNEDKILADYFKKYGKSINTDNFRQFFKEQGYTGQNSAAVQEPSSYLAKRARTIALKNEGDYVVGTAGGSGVGKTSAAKGIPTMTDLHKDAAFTLDSNFSSIKSARDFINEIKAGGKEFIGVYTYREFMDSLENGIIKRMLTNKEEMGRVVPNKVTAGNHVSSWDVVKQLHNEGEQFHFIDNSLGAGKAKLVSKAELESKIKYPPVEKLTRDANAIIKKLYESKKPFVDEQGVKHFITKEQYNALVE